MIRTLAKFCIKPALALVALLFIHGIAHAQPSQHSQAITRQLRYKTFTPGGLLDKVFDRLGHEYTLGEIAIDEQIKKASGDSTAGLLPVPPSFCGGGYFQLFIEPGSGMENYAVVGSPDEARMKVVCQVLQDISAFINSPCTASGQKVNIWIRNIGSLGPFAAVASSFYNIPNSMTVSGIADNAAWITINSGKDAFTNVASPLFTTGSGSGFGSNYFHALVAFDFGGSINWNTNLAAPPGAGQTDMYTTALHEITHALGFASLINYTGFSQFGPSYNYFDRYDMHLKTPGGTNLIGNIGSCNLYQWQFNSSLTAATVLSPGGVTVCPSGYQTGAYVDHTICASAVQYVGATTQPVYTPDCYEPGSSLSHFEDECSVSTGFVLGAAGAATNNQYFVMANKVVLGAYSATTAPGAMKRYLTPEERLVLGDLGYNVNTSFGLASGVNLNYHTYGGSVLPGLGVAGINDGISSGGGFAYSTMPGGSVVISEASLLSNDYGTTGGSLSCINVVTGTGTVTSASGSITYTAGATDFGVMLLRYVPKSSTGAEGNITYVYVYVGDPACTATACDLVSNGGFENAVPTACNSIGSNVHCWNEYTVSPDIFRRTGTSSCAIPSSFLCTPATDVHFPGTSATNPNDRFLGFQGGWNGAIGRDVITETPQTQLSTPLVNGTTYHVSCWVKLANNLAGSGVVTINTHLGFSLSPSTTPLAPYVPGWTTYPPGLTPLCYFSIVQDDNDWHYYDTTLTYVGANASTLIVHPAEWLNPTTGPYAMYYLEYYLLDDVSIKPVTSASSFAMPKKLCTGNAPIDLRTLVTIPGGVFSWAADSAGFVVVSHDSTFNVLSAWNASMISGSPSGRVTVCYDYTDVLGCKGTVCAETRITNVVIPIINGLSSVCQGATITLSDTSTGGTWTSSNISIASINSTTGIVTGVAGGFTTITYTLTSAACGYVTKSITVNALPGAIAGTLTTAVGASTTLSDAVSGGTWSSSNLAVATVNTTTGVVGGVAAGTTKITYTIPCGSAYTTVTVTAVTRPRTGIQGQQSANAGLHVYPNPSKGVLSITGAMSSAKTEDVQVEIADVAGKVYYKTSGRAEHGAINLSISLDERIVNGVYTVKLTGGGESRVARFVLER